MSNGPNLIKKATGPVSAKYPAFLTVFPSIMVVVGGLGSLPGAVIGAIIIVLMPEILRSSGELRLILFGALVVVLMGMGRGGIAGLASVIGGRISRRRRTLTGATLDSGDLKT